MPPKMLLRRPTGSVERINLTATYPEVVLEYAHRIRDLLDIGRDRVLWAATLAASLYPPADPVSYPDMVTGTTRTVTYTKKLYEVVRHIGRARFYRRHAWLAYFGMTQRYEATIAILRLFTPELDELESQLVSSSAEVKPCPIIPPVRVLTKRPPGRPKKPKAPKLVKEKKPPKPKKKRVAGTAQDKRRGPRAEERGGWRKKPKAPPTED